ncbi:MAG: hypothetical protein QME60_07855 [Verrucomicrobiota bacterium]|nr:hypothetical protein [Verrucomicrobiota bacterium]
MKRRLAMMAVGMGSVCLLLCGCAMFRASTSDVDPNQPKHMTAKYDYTDLRQLTETVANEFLVSPLMTKQTQPPLMRLGNIQNRTEQHVDTKALGDRIRTLLVQANKVQFVTEAQRDEVLKEQEHQAKHGEKGAQVVQGQQANPRYMLTGSLVEIKTGEPRQVRISRKEVRYYNMTIEVTDLQSGKLEWTTQKEITRQASQPLVGW